MILLKFNWCTKKIHIFNVYNLMSLDICIYLWYFHHNQGNKHIRHFQVSLYFMVPLCVCVCVYVWQEHETYSLNKILSE